MFPFPDFEGGSLAWKHEQFVSGAALSRLRDQVADRPDHPDRGLLADSQRRARGEPFGSTWQLWTMGEGQWRLNHDFYADDRQMYWDLVQMPEREWWLSESDLRVFDPSADPIPGANVDRAAIAARSALVRLLTMRLPAIVEAELEVGTVRVHPGGRFTFEAATRDDHDGPDYTLGFEGYWDRTAERGFITRCTVLVNELKPSIVGQTHLAESWAYIEDAGLWIAGSVEQKNPDNAITTVLRFVDFTAGTADDLDRITQIPAIDGADPIRGDVMSTRYTDHRAGIASVRLEDGTFQEFQVETDSDDAAGRLRFLGWIALGAAAVAVTAVLYKRIATR